MEDGLSSRSLRFVRSLLAGGLATLVDLTSLAFLVEIARLSPVQANLPALLAGAITQFFGSRGFVFQATHGALGPQVAGFALVEAGTLALNAVSFHLAATYAPLPYPLTRLLCQFAVYAGFSYPLWKRVFTVRSATASSHRPAPGNELG